jgi:hypothetical protein
MDTPAIGNRKRAGKERSAAATGTISRNQQATGTSTTAGLRWETQRAVCANEGWKTIPAVPALALNVLNEWGE